MSGDIYGLTYQTRSPQLVALRAAAINTERQTAEIAVALRAQEEERSTPVKAAEQERATIAALPKLPDGDSPIEDNPYLEVSPVTPHRFNVST